MSSDDEAAEQNRRRRDLSSFVSFANDDDDIIEDSDALGESTRESAESEGSEGSQESHDEGEDRLGPMEGQVQEARVLPRQAARMALQNKNAKQRLSIGIDIETGKNGGARANSAHVSVYRALVFSGSASIQHHFSLPIKPFCFLGYPASYFKSGLPSSQNVR